MIPRVFYQKEDCFFTKVFTEQDSLLTCGMTVARSAAQAYLFYGTSTVMKSEENAEMGRPTVIIYARPNLSYSEHNMYPAVQSSERLPICKNEK